MNTIPVKAVKAILAKLRRTCGCKFMTAEDYHPAPYTSGYMQALDDMRALLPTDKAVRK